MLEETLQEATKLGLSNNFEDVKIQKRWAVVRFNLESVGPQKASFSQWSFVASVKPRTSNHLLRMVIVISWQVATYKTSSYWYLQNGFSVFTHQND